MVYGAVQQSGLSATHQEYREARESRPVLAFVQEPATPEAEQAAYAETELWCSRRSPMSMARVGGSTKRIGVAERLL